MVSAQGDKFSIQNTHDNELVTICDRFNGLKYLSVNPLAFAEQEAAMLSAVLKSETAIYTSIRIVDAFVAMRTFLKNGMY